MIAVQHLSMRLTAAGRPVTILDDVTLEIPSKQTVAVMGPSGSGKSTLLGLMAGLDRPTAGRSRWTAPRLPRCPKAEWPSSGARRSATSFSPSI